HDQAWEIPENISVDRVEQTRIFSLHLIEDHEQNNEFALHIFWRAVGTGHTFCRDDDRPQQPGIDLPLCFHVCVVPPNNRTGITRHRTAVSIRQPTVGKAATGRYSRSRSIRSVNRAFVILVIVKSVWMNAVRNIAAIQELYKDGVADFGANDRPQNTEPLW